MCSIFLEKITHMYNHELPNITNEEFSKNTIMNSTRNEGHVAGKAEGRKEGLLSEKIKNIKSTNFDTEINKFMIFSSIRGNQK